MASPQLKCRLLLPMFLWVFTILHKGISLNLNLRDKIATQSTTYYAANDYIHLTAGLAIDGDTSTISHTECSGNQWWRLDLGSAYCLTKITIVNRQDSHGWRLTGAVVRAGLMRYRSLNTQIGDAVTSSQATNGAVIDFTSDSAITARYVSVGLTGTCLQLAEVRISTDNVIASVMQTGVSSTSLTVSWSTVSCAGHYIVEYALTNMKNCESIDQPTYSSACDTCQESTTTISGLLPFSQYTVRVKAYVYGAYGPTQSATFATSSTVPSGPPTAVAPRSQAQHSLSFSWSPPACGNRDGVITGYDYRLSTSGAATSTGQTTVTIDRLTPYTSYSFQVAARTSGGTGPYSAAVTSRTQEAAPTVPRNVQTQSTGVTSVSLSWSQPDTPNGLITHYNIKYWRSGDDAQTVSNVMGLTHRVTSLADFVTYTFQVQAVTSAGAGPWSGQIEAITLQIVLPSSIELWDWKANSTTGNDTSYLVAGVGHQFTCVVTSVRPGADFNWTLGGMVITADTNVDTTDPEGLITSTSSVTLTPSWAYHGEKLRCWASNHNSSSGVYVSSTLDVKVPPTQSSLTLYDAEGTRPGPTVNVDRGASYNFTCLVQGTRPAATIRWFLGSALQRTVHPPSGVSDNLVDTADSLAFAPNRSVNGVQLRCVAATPESREPLSSVATTLNVYVLPTEIYLYDSGWNSTYANGTPYLIAGVEHQFACEVPGIEPAASIAWTLGSRGIAPNATSSVPGPDGLITSSSIVTVLPTGSNQGEFLQCRASNKPGHPGLNVSAALYVEVPPQESSVSLHDLHGLPLGTSVDVDEGTLATFTCVVRGTRPAATIGWFLDGVLNSTVSPVDDEQLIEEIVNTTATWALTPEMKHHRRGLTCEASTAGSSRPLPSVTVALNVKVLPKQMSLFDSSGNYLSNDTAYLIEGVDHRFTCVVADINPGASITWTLANQELEGNGSDVTDTSGFHTSTSYVRISPTWADHGRALMCGATNIEGHLGLSTAVVLDIKVPPRSSPILLYNASRTSLVTTFVVEQGSPSSIRCEVQDTRPAVTIKWFLNGSLQRLADPRYKGDTGLVNTSDTWSFTPSRANHGQEVKCVASTAESHEPLPSKTCNLEVHGPPDLPRIVGNATMTEGIATTLTCYADMGFPDDWLLYWSFGDTYDIANLTTVASASGDRFLFTSVLSVTPTREDNGKTITCTARKAFSTVHLTTTFGPINVHFCPRMVGITNCPLKGIPDSVVSFNCVSESSNPMTNLTWMQNGRHQTNPAQPATAAEGDFGGHVTREDYRTSLLTKEDNGALFSCCAGKTSACPADVCDSCLLNVEYRPYFSQSTVITHTPVREGDDDDVILSCSAIANPMPADFITWEKVGSPSSLRSAYSDGTSNLTLSSVVREQAGPYRCRGNNGVPPVVYSNAVDIAVYYEVNITNKVENYVGAANGEGAVLPCTAVGNPLPLIVWYGPTNEVIDDDTDPGRITQAVTVTGGDDVYGYSVTSTIEIKRVTAGGDYGRYTCYSGNGVGRVDTLAIDLNVKVLPSPPYDVSIDQKRTTANSVTVTWHPGSEVGVPQWFHVNYRELGNATDLDPGARSHILQGSHEYTMRGLRPYAVYEVEVYAENALGRSEAVQLVARTSLLPAAPTNVSIDEAVNTATSITVSWSPSNEVAPNTWYRVNYRELSTTVDLDPSTRSGRLHGVASFTVMGLRPYSVYEVDVYAANANGASEAVTILGTTALCTRMVSVTGCPYRIVAGSGSVSLSCVSESTSPATNLTWLRENVEQTSRARPMITEGDYGGRVTTLGFTTGALTRAADGVEYKCCAVRPSVCVTDVCDTCSLNVEYRPFFSEPVVLTDGPVEEGDDVILSCSADANPMPPDFIAWDRVGSPDILASVYSAGTSTLTIRGITREQTGSYRCRGNNGIPPVVLSAPVDVIVHFGVLITNPENNYAEADIGERAALVCTAEGNPYPMVTWLGPTGTRLTNQSHPGRMSLVETINVRGGGVEGYYTVTSTLHIGAVTGAEDYGYYVCGCGNGIGLVDTLAILLNSRVEPVPPTNVSIDQGRITANSLTVTWIRGKKTVGPKQWILVKHRELDTTTGFDPGARSERLYDVSECTVVGLLPDTGYEVGVYAENVNGVTDSLRIIGRTLLEFDNTTPKVNAETSAANYVLKTCNPLIEVDRTTPEVNIETSAASGAMKTSKTPSKFGAQRRANTVVAHDDSGLVAGIIVVSVVALICIAVIVAGFVYHRRSTIYNMEVTDRHSKLTCHSIKYEEDSDVMIDKAETVDIPLQVLTSDPGETTRVHEPNNN